MQYIIADTVDAAQRDINRKLKDGWKVVPGTIKIESGSTSRIPILVAVLEKEESNEDDNSKSI